MFCGSRSIVDTGWYSDSVHVITCVISHNFGPRYKGTRLDLSNDVTMHVDIHGFDTRGADNMELYIPRCTKKFFCIRVVHNGISFPVGQSIYVFKQFKAQLETLNGWIQPELKCPFICTSILCAILILLFIIIVYSWSNQFVSETYLNFIMILLLLCMNYIYECVYMCSLYLNILLPTIEKHHWKTV